MRLVLLTTASLLAISGTVHASTIYNYTGNYFNYRGGVGPSLYTASDRVTGFFETTSPLAANLKFATITPEDFSYSDGHQTINSDNATLRAFLGLTTNANGEITQFFFQLGSGSGGIQMDDENGVGN